MSKPVREYAPPIPSILILVSLVLDILTRFVQLLGPDAKWGSLVAGFGAVWLWLARKPSRRASKRRQPYPLWLRIIGTAVAGLMIVMNFGPPLRLWWVNRGKVVVVLAEFEDPKGMNLTSHLANSLAAGLAGFSDARLIRIHDTLREGTDSATAAALGRRENATILIWGFCDRSDTAAFVTTHVEVLRPPKYMPELGPKARGQPRVITDMIELRTFGFSTRLGDEMAATCQLTLGMVHYSAGDRAGAVRPLLTALSRDSASGLDPRGAAAARFFLGNAYRTLATVYDTAANRQRAIEAYQEALKFYTIDSHPMEYAATQANLGIAYVTVSGTKDSTANLRRAVAACQEALKVFAIGSSPMDYAKTQVALGFACQAMAEIEDKAANSRRAIAAYQEVLKIYTIGSHPREYAKTQCSLGIAYETLAEVEDRTGNFRRAIAAYQEALKVYTADSYPDLHRDWSRYIEQLRNLYGSERDAVTRHPILLPAVPQLESVSGVLIAARESGRTTNYVLRDLWVQMTLPLTCRSNEPARHVVVLPYGWPKQDFALREALLSPTSKTVFTWETRREFGPSVGLGETVRMDVFVTNKYTDDSNQVVLHLLVLYENGEGRLFDTYILIKLRLGTRWLPSTTGRDSLVPWATGKRISVPVEVVNLTYPVGDLHSYTDEEAACARKRLGSVIQDW